MPVRAFLVASWGLLAEAALAGAFHLWTLGALLAFAAISAAVVYVWAEGVA